VFGTVQECIRVYYSSLTDSDHGVFFYEYTIYTRLLSVQARYSRLCPSY
jgi:hypothetical protein